MFERTPPKRVVTAVALLVASVLLGLLKIVLIPPPGPVWIAGVVVVVMLGLAVAIWAQRNWARILTLLLFLLGLPAIFLLGESLAREGTVVSIALFLLQTALQALALACLFTGPARKWFRRHESSEAVSATPGAAASARDL